MKDFYYILGTDVNSTSNEIREAYRKLSKKFHPDLNQNDNYFENRFKEIREAYETLNDPVKRSRYDATLKKLKPYPSAGEVKNQRYNFKTKYIDIAFTITLIIITLIFGDYVIKSIWRSKPAGVKTTAHTGTLSYHKISHHKRKHKFKAIPKPILADNRPNKIITNNKHLAKANADTAHILSIKAVPAIKLASPIKSKAVAKVIAPDTSRINQAFATKLAPPVKPAPINKPLITVKPTPPGVSNIKVDNKTVGDNRISQNTTASYTASIRSNATGIVYLRKIDNYNSDVVTTIPTNAQVLVLEKGKNFCKVTFNNKTGYVPNWTVQSK